MFVFSEVACARGRRDGYKFARRFPLRVFLVLFVLLTCRLIQGFLRKKCIALQRASVLRQRYETREEAHLRGEVGWVIGKDSNMAQSWPAGCPVQVVRVVALYSKKATNSKFCSTWSVRKLSKILTLFVHCMRHFHRRSGVAVSKGKSHGSESHVDTRRCITDLQ